MRRGFLILAGCMAITQVQAQGLPDPTRPLDLKSEVGMAQDGFPQVKINAVFVTAQGVHAIINGQSVNVGDSWQGLTLISLTRDSVVLARGQERKEYFITNTTFKKDVTNDF